MSDHVSPRWVEFSSTLGAMVSFGSTWLGLDIWSNLILDVYVRAFLDNIYIFMGVLGVLQIALHNVGGPYPTS